MRIARDGGRAAVLQVFVREGRPHCADTKVFLADLARERPELGKGFLDVKDITAGFPTI